MEIPNEWIQHSVYLRNLRETFLENRITFSIFNDVIDLLQSELQTKSADTINQLFKWTLSPNRKGLLKTFKDDDMIIDWLTLSDYLIMEAERHIIQNHIANTVLPRLVYRHVVACNTSSK